VTPLYCSSFLPVFDAYSLCKMLQCKPPLPQNRVPLVRDLCQALGFGDGYERAEHDLKDYTQRWRKQYTTDDGTRGKDLTDWKSAKVQNGLLRMTKDFLEIGGYAVSHWPSREEGRARNVPEYPRDHQK